MDALRNFKDFLQIYNIMSENCFNRCVNTFQTRDVTEEETNCIDLCTNKHVRVNHKIMAVYMEVQPLVMQRRVEEMEKLNPPVPIEQLPVSDAHVEQPEASEMSVEQPVVPELSAELSTVSEVPTEVNNSTEIPATLQ